MKTERWRWKDEDGSPPRSTLWTTRHTWPLALFFGAYHARWLKEPGKKTKPAIRRASGCFRRTSIALLQLMLESSHLTSLEKSRKEETKERPSGLAKIWQSGFSISILPEAGKNCFGHFLVLEVYLAEFPDAIRLYLFFDMSRLPFLSPNGQPTHVKK